MAAAAGILVQFVVLQGPAVLGATAGAVLHVLTYLAAGVVVVANRQVRGLWLLALGGAANGLTIAVNGGTLPASAPRWPPRASRRRHVRELRGVDDPVCRGSATCSPSRHGVPFANVFSVGDALIVAGAWWLIWATTRRRADAGGSGQASADLTADSGTSSQSGRFRVS